MNNDEIGNIFIILLAVMSSDENRVNDDSELVRRQEKGSFLLKRTNEISDAAMVKRKLLGQCKISSLNVY